MTTYTLDEAVRRMLEKIPTFGLHDMVEVHNELFPFDRVSAADSDRDQLLAKSVAYVETEAEPEELVDLWTVVFPSGRDVWFDEDDELMCVGDEPERVEATDC